MLVKKIILCLVALTSSQTIHSKLPLCISLGSACASALALRDLHIRTEAYPFDWTISPFDALYNALDNNFNDFLTDIRMRPDNTGVIDHYGFHFTHDWPTITNSNIDTLNSDYNTHGTLYAEWENALPCVREKYHRRIERFRNACLGEEKVFFLRSEDTKENAIILKELLKNKYPKLNFVLIVISNNADFKELWNIDHIKNFYSANWYDPNGWGKLFKQADPTFNELRTQKTRAFESPHGHEACCKS